MASDETTNDDVQQTVHDDNENDKSLEAENESLKAKIEELNEMISLQQYYIDEWREKYEEEKEENDDLKQEIKRIHTMEQENITLNNKISKKDEIIHQQKKRIYNLQNPSKWQWCDFEGYIWKDFEYKLSKQIDEKYQNNHQIYRHQLNNDQLYQFKFNENRQKMDDQMIGNKVNKNDNNESKTNDSENLSDLKGNTDSHIMTYFGSSIKTYFIQRVAINYKNNCFMNPTIWNGPARQTFGDKIMTLYHVTDKYAADIIKKTRTMKCGKIGRFGGGIYFAEKITTAQGRAHHKGYVITARVLIGNEYIIKENDQGQFDGTLSFQKLYNKQFDSVYAMHWTERVVYNADQVCILDIKKMSAFKFIFK